VNINLPHTLNLKWNKNKKRKGAENKNKKRKRLNRRLGLGSPNGPKNDSCVAQG
jgi:hypothetical protein